MWMTWLDTMLFSKTPLLFLEDVTIVWWNSKGKSTFEGATIATSKLRSRLPHLHQAGKLRFFWEQYEGDKNPKEITEEDERAAINIESRGKGEEDESDSETN